MVTKNKRLTILSEAEQFALYGLPDFDYNQRMQYLFFTDSELSLALSRPEISSQVYCALQIGYFKAKYAFFKFSWEDAEEDVTFIVSRYFKDQAFIPHTITKHEYYTQRNIIAKFFGYRPWAAIYLTQLTKKITQIVRRDVTTGFIVTELITYLNENKIIRPGYTILQTIISKAISTERTRLFGLITKILSESVRNELQQLLVREDNLSGLAALKQDAKHFGYRQMVLERKKYTTLEPIYRIANTHLSDFGISLQNINYYASLANFYSIYDLRRLEPPEQSYLYLLCYAWMRYRQITDNLIDATSYHMKRLEDEVKVKTNKSFFLEQVKRQEVETTKVGRLLLIYVDDEITDITPFGSIRQRAFSIMPKETLKITGQRLSEKQTSKLSLFWKTVDDVANRACIHLRPNYMILNFSSKTSDNPWIKALAWIKSIFSKHQRLSQQPITDCPKGTIPKSLRSYLLMFDESGNPTGVHANRYEFWIYKQIRKRLKSGDIYLDDSIQYRCFFDELVSLKEKASVISQLDIPWFKQPLDVQLTYLSDELHHQWQSFNSELSQGKLKHLKYDLKKKKLTWSRPKANNDNPRQDKFYDQISCCDVGDVLHFVNDQCHFLSALKPLQPRYAKPLSDQDSLIAAIIAQAMNHGNFTMAQISDIPYHVIETVYQQYLRMASLQSANDYISNEIAKLPIFPHYSFDLGIFYGSVDGQKFGVERTTVKARHSRKYFGRGKGVVAYTLLCNHVPLQCWIIGAHEFEAHHVFDIWYHNTSDIVLTSITGDMHSVNKANFAIMHWFGPRFEPRFTNLQDQLKHIYCTGDLAQYEKNLILPTGQIDLQVIMDEKDNIDQIVATLGLKEMTQSTLIRKLCTYTQPNPTRRAIFEFDKLIRSIYTLQYLRDPQLQRNVHRSQNRIEAYHQLRSTIAQVGGKKELTGRTDIEIEISNQCARLVANAIIYYNSAILSKLLVKYEADSNQNILNLIKRISPVSWRNIHLNGHYTFKKSGKTINLDEIVAELVLK
ncbi:MAG: Tn3 family transposase [Desulfobacterales bacterium]|nr:Tn3 family transposase [Desulfobacterales bacterium]